MSKKNYNYSLDRSRIFKKKLKSFPPEAQTAIKLAIADIAKNPLTPPDHYEKTKCRNRDVKKKLGDVYYIKPNYHYRLAYSFQNAIVYLIYTDTRENFYKDFENKFG